MTDADADRAPTGGYLTEDTGKRSAMRLMSLLFALTAIALAANEAALLWQSQQGNVMLVVYFLGAALTGKVGQKFMEKK